jgi:hypothetical protein
MAKKIIPATHRMKTGMCIAVPVYVRALIEELAEKKAVTLPEIGRMAFEEYVERETAATLNPIDALRYE